MPAPTEMLHRIDDHTVDGPGYRVSLPDAHVVIYATEGRTAHLQIESGAARDGQVDWRLHAESLTDWDPPDGGPVMSEAERQQILLRIGRALKTLGIHYKMA